jgi:class III poly(R)-hydroxyalkanoic acid synthase PhaC subunit
MSEDYARTYGEMVNALMAVKQEGSRLVDEVLEGLNMPTRREISTLHERFQESRREIRRVRRDLDELLAGRNGSGGGPLLISYALVNRPYMMDLQQDRSLIRRLLEQGLDIYLIDWGYPNGADRFLDLDDYINGFLHNCLQHVLDEHKIDAANVLGVCQGGTFSLCYTALHPERVKNLVTMVTPVDFRTPENLLSKWAQDMDVDAVVDSSGNVSGEMLNMAYVSLMPFRLMQQKYVSLVDILKDPRQVENFMRMEKWIFDSPDQAGDAFRQFTQWFFQENRLVKGTVELGGRKVDLKQITQPVLNIYGRQDHLVPPRSESWGTKTSTPARCAIPKATGRKPPGPSTGTPPGKRCSTRSESPSCRWFVGGS